MISNIIEHGLQMILSRLTRCVGQLLIGFSILGSTLAYAVNYTVTGFNIVTPAAPGFPPTIHLLLVSNDTVTVNAPPGFLFGAGPFISMEGGNLATVNVGAFVQPGSTPAIVSTLAATVPFEINNSGSITRTGAAGTVIDLSTVGAGGTPTIINSSTGTISGDILLPNTVTSFVNINGGTITGNISKVAGGPVATLNVNNTFNLGGAINNIDIINVVNAGTVLNTGANNISNFGTLTVDTGTTLNIGSTLTGTTLTNNGTLNLNAGNIIAAIGGTGALNLNTSFATSSPITGTQSITVGSGSFTIQNPVAYSSLVNNSTVNLNPGGSINGGMTSTSPASIFNINTPTTTTGAITNVKTINVSNSAFSVVNPITGFDTLNLIGISPLTLNAGGSLASSGGAGTGVFLNANTLTLNAGTIIGDITGTAGSNIILNSNFSSAGNINVTNLTVAAPATFTMNPANAIDVTGTLSNNGTIGILDASRTITGVFTQNGTGTLSTVIDANPAVYGNITAAAGSSFTGAVSLSLINSANIQNGAFFDIVRAPGLIVGPTTVIAPTSATLSFTPSPAPNVYRLVANRMPLSNPIFLGNVLGVGAALEQIRVSGTATPLQALILQRLDQLSTAEQVQLALLQLSPEANGGTLLSTMQMNELPFLKITRGLHSMRAANDYKMETGYNAGDIADGRGSYGPFIFAGNTTIKQKNGIPGFNALGSGVGFVADVPVTGYGPFCGSPFLTKIGAAGSYAGTRLRNNPNVMDSNITSWQGILYFTVDYNLFFMDGTVAWATNHYINTRHTFLGQNARGDFYGEQKTSRLNVGLNLPMGNLEVAPYFTTRNLKITQNPYVERGAPGENLSIKRRTAISQQGGGGVRFFDVSQIEDFLPEVHVLFLTELKSPNLSTQAIFVEGSPSFLTLGPPLAKQSIVFGFSASGVVVPGLIVTLAYDLETRNNFWSNYGSIKVRWIF